MPKVEYDWEDLQQQHELGRRLEKRGFGSAFDLVRWWECALWACKHPAKLLTPLSKLNPPRRIVCTRCDSTFELVK